MVTLCASIVRYRTERTHCEGETMTTTINDDLVVGGAVSAANFTFGSITITPRVNTPTSQGVGGLNLKGTGSVFVMACAESAFPWTRVREVGQRFATTAGFTVYIYRTDGADTNIHWLAMMEAAL